MQAAPIIELALKPSRYMAVLVLAAHLLAVVAVWLVDLPVGLHIGLKLVIATSLWLALRRLGWFNAPHFVANIRILPAQHGDAGDLVEATCRNGERLGGTLVDGNFVAPYLMTIGFRTAGATRWQPLKVVTVLPDSSDGESLRALRVRLKWGRSAPV